LATVYGIVKQNHGFVWAYSEAGMGTVFKIYLPCVKDRALPIDVSESSAEAIACGTETVLLVEDEDALRRATAEFLGLRGYTVMEAKDGQEALAVAANHRNIIDLVVTDVVMPRVSGGQLAKDLLALRPESRVLFVSGYAGQTILDHKVVDVENNFLQKPFTLRQLVSKVRSVLDRSSIAG
jgi:DNA-binding NtrC family response regulator